MFAYALVFNNEGIKLMGDIKKSKFNSLTPELLEENEPIYTEALDYAFNNSEIKNIAITGIYGAGKSTVWNTYKKYKLNQVNEGSKENTLKNTITVSLGKFFDESAQELDKDNISLKDLDNRVERQLINQILSQIKSSDVLFSKYRFKTNLDQKDLFFRVMATISFVASIWLLVIKDVFVQYGINNFLYLFCTIMFFVPLTFFLWLFYRENKVKLYKINVKGAEANINDENSDETVLDRDIKELVYLLDNSKTTVVVFEDLDRYDNIEVFTKLRELNFLLNHFIKVNGDERIVRFVYMLRDGLFFSKNRTKFFDFILPIVPIVDSKTSENKLIELLKDIENRPSGSVIANISLYVDDMRLLKSIVNEYIVYSKIVPLNKINLEADKLFALIILKNIFPNEFDLLQEDKGFIVEVFDEVDRYRCVLIKQFQKQISDIIQKIRILKSSIVADKYEAMALCIPSDVSLNYDQGKTWPKLLKEWNENPDISFSIKYSSNTEIFTYEKFVERFILINNDTSSLIKLLSDSKRIELNRLNDEKIKLEAQMKNVKIDNYRQLILKMNAEEIEKLFQLNDYKIIENHYFPLIRYLIINGLLDETYWYYKGNFDIDSSNTLKRNDLVYKKGLLESQKLDVFLKLETPNEVLNRLDILDFNRSNILNRDILQACLEEEKTEFIIELMNTVDSNNSYRNLVRILETFDLEIIRKFVDVLVRDNADKLLNVLTLCYKLYSSTFRDILISIFITGLVPAHSLEIFRWYIEENEELISLISEEDFEIFIYNINNIGAKFNSLSKINIDKDRLIQIEQKQAFKLNVQNFIAITEKVLEKKIHYGNLLNEIYKSNLLSVSKNYIADNFNIFITGYIDENQNGELFTNDEKILIQILESEIDIDYKIKYLEKNKTILTNLTSIEEKSLSKEILDCLLNKNTIKFSSENIKKCWSLINVVSEKFASYINQNLKIDNSETVLANDELICKEFINSPLINDKSFELIIDYVNKAIDNINPKLSRARVKALAKSNLIGTTLENLQVLLENSYIEEIIWLVNSADIEVENEVISILLTQNLSEDLIYDLVNNDISDENGKQLLELIRDRISVERIDSQKIAIIEEILDEEISIENINYICGHFSEFNLKEKFLENLIVRGMLETLNNENLNQEFMRYTLDSGIVSLDTKISLIVRKIESGTPVEELEDYFDSIEEIKDLSGVWNHKRPLLDSYWKEHIGEALDKAKYVKKRNDQKGCRIEKR